MDGDTLSAAAQMTTRQALGLMIAMRHAIALANWPPLPGVSRDMQLAALDVAIYTLNTRDSQESFRMGGWGPEQPTTTDADLNASKG